MLHLLFSCLHHIGNVQYLLPVPFPVPVPVPIPVPGSCPESKSCASCKLLSVQTVEWWDRCDSDSVVRSFQQHHHTQSGHAIVSNALLTRNMLRFLWENYPISVKYWMMTWNRQLTLTGVIQNAAAAVGTDSSQTSGHPLVTNFTLPAFTWSCPRFLNS